MTVMFTYTLVTILACILGLLGYQSIGKKLNILDKPNERSSHNTATIRGAGVVMIVPLLLVLFFDASREALLTITSLGIGIVTGFLDDKYSLKPTSRFLLYFLAVALLLFGVLELHRFDSYVYIPLIIVMLGAVNTYNFMDGINGITSLYSLVLLSSLLYCIQVLGVVANPLFVLGLMVYFLVFLFFNLRTRAKMFLGDSGSVAIGLFAIFGVSTIGLYFQSWTPILMIAVYGVDSVGTILLRLLNRENIFKAHRSHLYQDLVHKKGFSHQATSITYAAVQLFINIAIIPSFGSEYSPILGYTLLSFLTVVFLYFKFKFYGDQLISPYSN